MTCRLVRYKCYRPSQSQKHNLNPASCCSSLDWLPRALGKKPHSSLPYKINACLIFIPLPPSPSTPFPSKLILIPWSAFAACEHTCTWLKQIGKKPKFCFIHNLKFRKCIILCETLANSIKQNTQQGRKEKTKRGSQKSRT